MIISTIDKELLRYVTQLDESQKKSLLEMIRTFLKSGNEPIEEATIEQYNSEIDQAMERTSKGEFITLEELEKEMQSW